MSQPTAGDRTKSDPSHKPTILINESSDLALCAGGRNPGERSVPSSPTRSRPRSRSLQPDHGETAPNHPTLTAPRSPPGATAHPDADVTPVPLPPSPAPQLARRHLTASPRTGPRITGIESSGRRPSRLLLAERDRALRRGPARTSALPSSPKRLPAACRRKANAIVRESRDFRRATHVNQHRRRGLPLIGMFALPSTERGWSITRLAAATPTRLRGISPRT